MQNKISNQTWSLIHDLIQQDANWIYNQCNYKFYHDKQEMMIPCGKCANCRKKDKNRLVSRLTLEDRIAVSAFFVTLTYNDQHLPIINGVPSLNPKHVTDFIKRVRNYLNGVGKAGPYKIGVDQKAIHDNLKAQGKNFKYFLVGDYGDVYQRPLYHLILYNIHHEMKIPLTRLWGKGKIDFQAPRNAQSTIQYSASYMVKQANYPFGAIKPFRRMSRNLGLGFLKRFPDSMRAGLIETSFVKFRPPQNWQDWRYTKEEQDVIRENYKKTQIETYHKQYDALAKVGVEPTHMMEGIRRLKEAHTLRKIEKGKSSKM